MKKFVSLCAFVAALSFASCDSQQTKNTEVTDSIATAVEEAVAPVQETVEAVDSLATEVVETVDSVVAQ